MERVPEPSYYVAMPTLRTRPEWYPSINAELASMVVRILKTLRPSPRPLPAFLMSGQDLDTDGIHLNALAGMTYVQHLIDKPRYLYLFQKILLFTCSYTQTLFPLSPPTHYREKDQSPLPPNYNLRPPCGGRSLLLSCFEKSICPNFSR